MLKRKAFYLREMLDLMTHCFYISTKGQADLSPKATNFGLPHTYLNIFFSEIIGLFELKFHIIAYSVYKQYSYNICFRSLDQNGHHAHIWSNNISLNNLPKLTLTYFNIIKAIR